MGFTKEPNQLNEVLFNRLTDVVGGTDVLMAGKPGSGKTTGLAQFARLNKKINNDVIIWRGSLDCQWSLLLNAKPPEKLILWLKEGLPFTLIDRNNERKTPLSRYFHEIKTFDEARDLVANLDRKYINVVQTTPFSPVDPKQHIQFCREWMEIFNELNKRVWKNPVSVYFDELEDLVPEAKGKAFWDIELSLSSIIRSLRKNYVSSFFACHSIEEVHWRIRKKIRWKIYMRGAKPESGSRLIINVNKLPVGRAWIEGDQIEKFDFQPLGRELMLRAIEE